MKFGVVVFPGSNCDDDMVHVIGTVMGAEVRKLWHKNPSLEGFTDQDCIILPGGFSYGDYLRSGAIAAQSPIIRSVRKFAENGGMVFGICNGFQILCEMQLLPGALLRNRDQLFVSKSIDIAVVEGESRLTKGLKGKVLHMPVAHAEGRYYADKKTLEHLEQNQQVLFRYCDAKGQINDASNFNGSLNNIAGIRNTEGNIFGMMPHPERASEKCLGCEDGKQLFATLLGELVTTNS